MSLAISSLGCKEEIKPGADVESRPPIEVSSNVDKAVATTGDIITYTLAVNSSPEVKVQIPEVGAKIAEFRIVDMGTEGPKETESRTTIEKWYKLRADTVGSYIIPPVKLTYQLKSDPEQKEVQTSQIVVEVKSALATGEKQKDIIGIKPLEELKIDYVWWSIVIGGVVIVILLISGGVIYYRKRKKIQGVVIELPPHEVALAELNKLKTMKYADAKEIKKLYFELSETFRRYLERRYGFPATDWTSEEIAYHINRNRDLNFELKEQSKSFLSNTDIVKFAEYLPQETQIKQELNGAISFVEATKEVLVEETAANAV